VTAAGIVFRQLARKHLEGIAGEGQVIRTVGAVLAWCGYQESIMDLPLDHLLPIEDEWGENRRRTREELAEVVRDAYKEQLAKDSDHINSCPARCGPADSPTWARPTASGASRTTV
jgi:hypothetical protein